MNDNDVLIFLIIKMVVYWSRHLERYPDPSFQHLLSQDEQESGKQWIGLYYHVLCVEHGIVYSMVISNLFIQWKQEQ